MRHSTRLGVLLFIAGFLQVIVFGADSVPKLQSHVNDYANKLSVTEKNDLEQKLVAFERESSNQIVILTTPSLGGDSIEVYAQRVFHEWKLGQKDNNNGVLIVWAPNEHRSRIHVGYGLEGRLTDAISSQIIRNDLGPNLRAGHGYTGFTKAIEGIIKAVKGEYVATTETNAEKGVSGGAIMVLLICLLVVFVCGCIHPGLGAFVGVCVGAGLGIFMWDSSLAAIVLGILGFVLGIISRAIASSSGSGGGSSDSFFSSSGSSSGGSDFSGGGGDSGGGGASGDG